MMRIPTATCLPLLIALQALLPAQLSGTYTVDPTAASSGRNFASLREAVDALRQQGLGGAVVIELVDDAGPYTERHPFVTSNATWGTSDAVLTLDRFPGSAPDRRVTFRAAPGERPVLDASGRAMGVFWNGATYVSLEGLEIRNADFDGISLYTESMHGQVESAVIRGCEIHACGGSGIVVYGNLPAPRATLIESNVLWDLQRAPAGGLTNVGRFAYLNVRRTEGTVVRHNTFWANRGVNPWFSVVGALPGSFTDQPLAGFLHNVVVKTVRPDRPLISFASLGGVTSIPLVMDANLFHHPAGGAFAAVGDAGRTSLPDIATWSALTGLDLSSTVADPRLEAPLQGNFRPTAASPTINRALGARSGSRDAADTLRVADRPDVGAFEWLAPWAPSARSLGGSAPGRQGELARLVPSREPSLGALDFEIAIEGGTPGTVAWLFAAPGAAQAPYRLAGGAALVLDVAGLWSWIHQGIGPLGPVPAGGIAARFALPILPRPALAGTRLYVQALLLDPALGTDLQVTDGLELTLY